MLSAGWQTTSKSLSVLSLWTPPMPPSNGGMANRHHGPRHYVLHGLSPPISNKNWRSSYGSGISRCLTTRSHATTHPSRLFFIKHAAVLDQLCNHKKAIDDWSTSNPAVCCGKHCASYKSAALNPSDPHWVLAGSLLHSLLPPELAVVAEGSRSNKVFPSKKECYNQMRLGMKNWTT